MFFLAGGYLTPEILIPQKEFLMQEINVF